MSKKNRIIVLIDFSEYSENLIDFAFNFSDCIEARVVFLHQVSGMVPAMSDQESRDHIIRNEKLEALDKLKKASKRRLHGDDSFIATDKNILSALLELKSPTFTDWIFAGLKGTGVLKRIFIGSTTLSIINDSDLLTVAVPIKQPIAVPKKLSVGITCAYPLNKVQFNILLSSMSEQIEEIEFFTILQKGEDEEVAKNYLEELKTEYTSYNSSTFITLGENKFNAVKQHLTQAENRFLVLQQGSRSLEDNLFRKFMINDIVYSAHTPLIVLSK